MKFELGFCFLEGVVGRCHLVEQRAAILQTANQIVELPDAVGIGLGDGAKQIGAAEDRRLKLLLKRPELSTCLLDLLAGSGHLDLEAIMPHRPPHQVEDSLRIHPLPKHAHDAFRQSHLLLAGQAGVIDLVQKAVAAIQIDAVLEFLIQRPYGHKGQGDQDADNGDFPPQITFIHDDSSLDERHGRPQGIRRKNRVLRAMSSPAHRAPDETPPGHGLIRPGSRSAQEPGKQTGAPESRSEGRRVSPESGRPRCVRCFDLVGERQEPAGWP